jgi:hypothetical protein
MLKSLKSITAAIAWCLCYVPLNAFIVLVFFKQILRGGKGSHLQPSPPGDDLRIKELVEKNLGLYLGPEANEGMGTRYERRMVDRLLMRLAREHGIDSILEAPADGITGVPGANSLCLRETVPGPIFLCNPSGLLLEKALETWQHMGLKGRAVAASGSVACLPFPVRSFGLCWSFCMLEQMTGAAGYLREMARVSSGIVLVVTVNANAGLRLHRQWHKALNRPWDHGRGELMTAQGLRRAFEEAGLEVLELGGVDVPPSLDSSDMPLGGDIGRLMGFLGKKWQWSLKQDDSRDPALLSFFAWMEDNLPEKFKICHAHHLYAVGRRRVGRERING